MNDLIMSHGRARGRSLIGLMHSCRRFVELVDRVENASPEAAEHALKAFLRETTAMELQVTLMLPVWFTAPSLPDVTLSLMQPLIQPAPLQQPSLALHALPIRRPSMRLSAAPRGRNKRATWRSSSSCKNTLNR